jgi:two-component system response regulator HydG
MSSSSLSALVVDDDIAVCRILHRMLTDEQYQVQISQSVADALRFVDEKPYDVYVMDYKLPDGTGLDVAERIRSKGSEAPIILISGYDPSAVAVRAQKLRIFDIIEKPFARATICNAVKNAIGFKPTADQNAVELATPGEGIASGSSRAEGSPPITKKGLPKAAVIGAIIFILLLSSCLAFYLLTHH